MKHHEATITRWKDSLIMQEINRGCRRISEIAALNNLGRSTLTGWIRQYTLGIAPASKSSESNVNRDNKPLNAEQNFNTYWHQTN
jgi:transposase-like protein